jgi:outer membrane receptor for ferrienterochelin and colicin
MKGKILIFIFLFPLLLFAQQKNTHSGSIYEKGSLDSLPVITLEPVNITAENKSTEVAQMSMHTISALEVKSVPMLFGEKDLFKTLILMPGVSSGTEGASGIFVRGGSPDQNLIILDEATIYNANHLLGFFSIFNGNAIKSAELIKGGFPARYGGRLSSVIDVKMKEGNKQSYHGEGGVGLLSGNFMVEGPIVKNKSSFMVSGRRTWFDLLMRPVMSLVTDGFSTGYFFYDLNTKLNYDFNDKNKLYVSAYFGRDKFVSSVKDNWGMYKSKYNAGLYWQNGLTTVRWNHMFFNKLFSNLSFIFSDYTMNVFQNYSEEYGKEKEYFGVDFNSGIRDYSLKYDLTYIPNPLNTILMGAMVTYHEARPNAVQVKMNTLNSKKTTLAQGLEYILYVEDEINIKNKLRINPGFRLNFFSVPQQTYVLPEPRLSVGYNFRKDLSIKASYAMMNQYMLLLSSSTIGLPTDLWVPVTKNIRPQRSQQVALGLVYEPKKIGMTFSVEGYYKKLNRIIAYLPGSSFLSGLEGALWGNSDDNNNMDWESKITVGQGWSYGVEFLARRTVGKFTGWVGYTLSWSQQQFKELNYGEKFWARNDRRHDLSIVLMYSPTKRINLSLSWVYATGNALTLPDDTYRVETVNDILTKYTNIQQGGKDWWEWVSSAENFGKKNDFRMEAFHHLDVSVQFIRPHRKNPRFESIFELSVYNLYNHKNPFIYITRDTWNPRDDSYSRRLAKVTIFPIIPSFTYSFRF